MYVKAPKAIIDYLATFGYDHSLDRQTFADGTYLLWHRDLLPLGDMSEVEPRLPALGCVVLTSQQVRALQDGETPDPMPEITDPALMGFMGLQFDPFEEPEDSKEGGDAV